MIAAVDDPRAFCRLEDNNLTVPSLRHGHQTDDPAAGPGEILPPNAGDAPPTEMQEEDRVSYYHQPVGF
jgi:hypothetical protein